MDNWIANLLASGGGGIIISAIIIWFFRTYISNRISQSVKHEYDLKLAEIKGLIQTEVSQKYERWILKRNACLKALKLANAVLSNYEVKDLTTGKKLEAERQYVTIEEARACIDEIASSCESSEVLEILKKIMFGISTYDIIVDLRNAVRKELGFKEELDKDRSKAFIAKLDCTKSI